MTEFAPWPALTGGILIGLSAVLLMWSLGRTAGISGILLRLLTAREDIAWRAAFLVGLPLGAALVALSGWKSLSGISLEATGAATVVAGLLVGMGTTIGSGCTSGHGICGNARLSRRSLAATLVFMTVAGATVFILRHVI